MSKVLRRIIFALILIPVVVFISVIFFSSSQYETDFPPPSPNAGVNEVFPETINGKQRTLKKLPIEDELYKGFQAWYGETQEIQISVVQSRDPAAADKYFENTIVPQIDTMPNHSRARVNGRWFAKGTDAHGGRWYGWVNRNWVFWVFGVNKKLLNQAIDEFSYISR